MNFTLDLSGTTAVVTGTSGKLGRVWVEALLGNGAKVCCLDLHTEKDAPNVASWVSEYGKDRVHYVSADICDRESLLRAKESCIEHLGTPQVLVNNAGIDTPPASGQYHRLEDFPAELFLPTMNVNVYGSFLCAQVFGSSMIAAGGGSIINIGSLYTSVSPDESFYSHIECDPPFIKPPAYGASKAALLNLTRYMATHWGKHGIRSNMLSPGGVLGGQDEEFISKFCSRVPLQRMAEDNDLVGPLLFLASDASAYVTGINLNIDGGFTSW